MKTPSTGPPSTPVDVDGRLEGLVLPAEGVAAHDHVDAADGLLARARVEDLVGEHDHAGAGAVDGHARRDALAQRLHHAEEDGQLGHGGGLAAGDDQAVDLGELLGAPHRPGHGVRRGQGDQVLPYVALEGQDADHRGVAHQ